MLSNQLKPFRDAMVATLLMYYQETKTALGTGSPIIRAIHRAALESSIELGHLPQFSKLIMERFKIVNAKNMAADNDEAIENLTRMCVHMLDEQKETKASLQRVEGKKLDQVMGAIETLAITTPGSGSKRTRRESGIEPEILDGRFANGPAPPAAAAPSASSAVGAGQAPRLGPTPSAPRQDAFAALAHGRDLDATYEWSKLGEWSAHQLLMACLKLNQDWTRPNFLPQTLFPASVDSSTLRTLRARAKSVLDALHGAAVAIDQSFGKWFEVSRVPKDEDEKRSFLEDLTHQLVEEWMTQVVNVLYQTRRRDLDQQRSELEAQAALAGPEEERAVDKKLKKNQTQRNNLDKGQECNGNR